jgi:hypothetical protein
MDNFTLRRALGDLGALIDERGLTYDLVVIGGATLLLRGMVTRAVTRDVDVIAEVGADGLVAMHELPAPLSEAVRDIATIHGLAPDWLNTAPAGLMDLGLPDRFSERLVSERMGGLTLRHPGREDLIAFKLYAVVDGWPSRDTRHVSDLRALDPTPQELLAGARWTRTHDPSPGYLSNLRAVLAFLGVGGHDDDLQ